MLGAYLEQTICSSFLSSKRVFVFLHEKNDLSRHLLVSPLHVYVHFLVFTAVASSLRCLHYILALHLYPSCSSFSHWVVRCTYAPYYAIIFIKTSFLHFVSCANISQSCVVHDISSTPRELHRFAPAFRRASLSQPHLDFVHPRANCCKLVAAHCNCSLHEYTFGYALGWH